MKRIYITASSPTPANTLAAQLKSAGHEIISNWHGEPVPPLPLEKRAEWQDRIGHSKSFIRTADVLVLLATPDGYMDVGEGDGSGIGDVPGAGKFYEAGCALGFGKKVAVVGRVENGMMWDMAIRRVADVKELVAWLDGGCK